MKAADQIAMLAAVGARNAAESAQAAAEAAAALEASWSYGRCYRSNRAAALAKPLQPPPQVPAVGTTGPPPLLAATGTLPPSPLPLPLPQPQQHAVGASTLNSDDSLVPSHSQDQLARAILTSGPKFTLGSARCQLEFLVAW